MIHENNRVSKYSLIDHIWANFKKGKEHLSGVIDYLITDHLPNFYMFSNNYKFASKIVRFRMIKQNNRDLFVNEVN